MAIHQGNRIRFGFQKAKGAAGAAPWCCFGIVLIVPANLICQGVNLVSTNSDTKVAGETPSVAENIAN